MRLKQRRESLRMWNKILISHGSVFVSKALFIQKRHSTTKHKVKYVTRDFTALTTRLWNEIKHELFKICVHKFPTQHEIYFTVQSDYLHSFYVVKEPLVILSIRVKFFNSWRPLLTERLLILIFHQSSSQSISPSFFASSLLNFQKELTCVCIK